MSQKPDSERFIFVDALRGVAAFAVVFYHLIQISGESGRGLAAIPDLVAIASEYGAFGVQIFFVLSGFVIAHSLRKNSLSLPSLGNFMLRRQIRLDPPYWTALAIALLLRFFESKIPSLTADPIPSAPVILLNLIYLQNLLNIPVLVGVAWTLCLEIQFYLFFIILLRMGKTFTRNSTVTGIPLPTLLLIYLTGVISLLLLRWPLGYFWFTRYWFYFASGVLSYWAFQKEIPKSWFFSFICTFAAVAVWSLLSGPIDPKSAFTAQRSTPVPLLVGLITASALWYLGDKGRLTRIGGGIVTQYLGKISYSLYLIHVFVITLLLRLAHKIGGTNSFTAWAWIAFAAACSIAFAHLLYVGVERSSMRFASLLNIRNQPRAVSMKQTTSSSS